MLKTLALVFGLTLAATAAFAESGGDMQVPLAVVAVGALARLADRHDDAAPVGVLAGDGDHAAE